MVRIVYDPSKDAANFRKHGISLADAQNFDWDRAVVEPDLRFNYGEERFIAMGYIGLRLHVLVFTMRNDVLRVISLRKANEREGDRYARA